MDLIAPPATGTFLLDHHLRPDDMAAALRHDVLTGLSAEAKALSPKWFYDDRGCELFEAVTEVPEYYPTRCERQILRARAAEIATACPAETLVELGSGTSIKTTLLLDALVDVGTLAASSPST
jgi:L-histidine N-alpha-methyltransferase